MCGVEPEDVEQVAGLARVVAAVQVHVRELVVAVQVAVLRQRADHVDDPGQGGLQQRRVVVVGPGGDQVQRDPAARRLATERFMPCLPRSTGLRPATSPPQGALVMHPSTARSSQVQPDHPVVGGQRRRSSAGPCPAWAHSRRRRRMVRSEQPGRGDAFVAAAVHQRGDHVVEHHPVGDPAAVTAPRDASGRTRDARRPRSGQRTRPTAARSAMLAAEARTLQVIIRRQQSHDHGRVRASTCSDTPPTSFAGRS